MEKQEQEKQEKQENQEKNTNMEDTIKVIREEYENKIAKMVEEHKAEIEKVRKEEHEKNVQTIRALMSGRQVENSENPAPKPEKSYEETLIEDTKRNFGL